MPHSAAKFGSHPSRLPSLVFVAAVASLAQAEIDYRVKIDPATKRVEVSIKIPTKPGAVSVQIPNWMPGHYVYDYYFKQIHDVAAVDPQGKPLAVEHPDDNTWTVNAAGGPVTFNYWVPVGAYKRFTAPKDDSFVQLAGAANYMYVVGRKPERCRISFDLPTGWPALIGLDATQGEPNTFVAPTYDVLADNPLSTGQLIVDQYRLRGKDHFIVLEGPIKDKLDRAAILKTCRFVSAAETDFFGGAPYHKYVWHFIVRPGLGGGGLEHLSSTQITIRNPADAPSLLAHEYFHLWNVKRTRAKVLGPFDYLTLPKTGALWWLEGVTDYYASLLVYRYGVSKRTDFLSSALGANLQAVIHNPARLEVSPYEASLKAIDSTAAKGTGGASNSGFKISFYNLGWLCGLCLDTEIRSRTHGKHSLDDVTKSLYNLCKNDKPGFEEDEIRKQCVRFGGPELGPFYDKVVMSPGELPVAEQLAKMGLILNLRSARMANPGFDTTSDPSGALFVSAITGSAARGKLMEGDRIISVDGVAAGGNAEQVGKLMSDHREGSKLESPMTLVVARGSDTLTIVIQPVVYQTTLCSAEDDPKATPEVVALRDQWLRIIKPTIE